MRIGTATMVAGCWFIAGCQAAPADPRGVGPDETLLTVSGTRRAESRPDQAIFNAGLENIAPTAKAASARANEAVGRIVAALSGPNLSVADPEVAALSAHGTAYKAARAKADAYAKAAGMRVVRVVRVVAIHDGGQGGVMPMMYAEESRGMARVQAVQPTAAPVMA